MLNKIEFCVISIFRREADVNQYSLRNNPEERSSQKRSLSVQGCVVETEKYVTEKLAFAKRHTYHFIKLWLKWNKVMLLYSFIFHQMYTFAL